MIEENKYGRRPRSMRLSDGAYAKLKEIILGWRCGIETDYDFAGETKPTKMRTFYINEGEWERARILRKAWRNHESDSEIRKKINPIPLG